MKQLFRLRCMLLGLGVLAAIPLAAVDTSFWQVGTFDEVLKGRLSGVSRDKDGAWRLAPESQPVVSRDGTMALSMAADRDGRRYIGPGQRAQGFRPVVGREA